MSDVTPVVPAKLFGAIVGEVLKECRQKCGIATQSDLAATLRLSQAIVSRVEIGELELNIAGFARWAQALGWPSTELLALAVARADEYAKRGHRILYDISPQE